jgi:hypothetical protein
MQTCIAPLQRGSDPPANLTAPRQLRCSYDCRADRQRPATAYPLRATRMSLREVPVGAIRLTRTHDHEPGPSGKAAEDVTLLYSSRDREHNDAVVLRDYLQARTVTKRRG